MSSNALSASLISAGLQSSAAQDIASNYSVVASTADVAFQGETGLNAVLLRRNGTDQYVLSISGVDAVADATETAIRSARYGFNEVQIMETLRNTGFRHVMILCLERPGRMNDDIRRDSGDRRNVEKG